MSKVALEPRVPASIIADAARAVKTVESIDAIIKWLNEDAVHSCEQWGDAIRGVFGRTRVSRLPDAVIGQVCHQALVDTLLLERRAITEDWEHLVEFPPSATQASDRTPGSVARPIRSEGEAARVRTEN